MRDGLGGRLDPVLAVPLRFVQGGVGGGEELGGGRRRRGRGDAEAGRDRDRRPVGRQDDAARQGQADALGDLGAPRQDGGQGGGQELPSPPAAGHDDAA